MRVLALASYPVEAASSRYRIVQFIEPLARRGIEVSFSPFLDAPLFERLYQPGRFLLRLPHLALRTLLRFGAAWRARKYDVVFVQREAMLFGPPVIEWLIARVLRKPLVLDLDDATWIAYESPVYGRFATFLKRPAKTDRLIRWARAVTCGSPHVAAYARGTLVPTVVDTKRFRPCSTGTPACAPCSTGTPAYAPCGTGTPACGDDGTNKSVCATPVIGWIGTHGTYPYVERLLPVLERLARDVQFRLRIIGSGRERIDVPGVEVETRPWRLEREVEEFQSLDIGIYPIDDDEWSTGKSGFKAVQYMATGVPFVMSPVGVCATMGLDGVTHLSATSDDEWLAALRRLVDDRELRRTMSAAGRAFAEEHFDVAQQADALAAVLRS
jgi:glycosyltransferase involved in cell wall biosynthesis